MTAAIVNVVVLSHSTRWSEPPISGDGALWRGAASIRVGHEAGYVRRNRRPLEGRCRDADWRATTPVTWLLANELGAVRRLLRKLEREASGPANVFYEAAPCGGRSRRCA